MKLAPNKSLFVTGIDTDVGKTIVSAVLCQALAASYWKPIQAGSLGRTDTHLIKKLCGKNVGLFDEAYLLKNAISPHAAAQLEDISIKLKNIKKPRSPNTLIIEGAGGVCVPLNPRQTNVDLMKQLKSPVILVVRNYLGSINHTLLSITVLKNYKICLAGMIISGERNPSSEAAYERLGKVPILAHIPHLTAVNKKNISALACSMSESLQNKLKSYL